jgi:hypothetical protein
MTNGLPWQVVASAALRILASLGFFHSCTAQVRQRGKRKRSRKLAQPLAASRTRRGGFLMSQIKPRNERAFSV